MLIVHLCFKQKRFGEDAFKTEKTIQSFYKEELFMDIIISLIPILIVLIGIIVLNKPAKVVAPISFVVTVIFGMTYFGVDLAHIWANAWSGIISGTKVVYMIMAAFCILNMLLDTGAMDKIRELIISISDDRRKHITIVAFGFGGFLEGCAGAGTPAAVAAPCLMGLGKPYVRSSRITYLKRYLVIMGCCRSYMFRWLRCYGC